MPEISKPEVQILGAYDLLAKVAEGGMGWVYKGRNRETNQIVAIKIVPSTMTKNDVLLKRFENEFRAASALNHPNIVRALDYCGTGATPFLVMEYVDGESLGQRLARENKMPENEAIVIIGQVCQGLHRAHKMGMIHRDVKPDNIMLTKDGNAKLTDLGLVKDLEAELNLTRTGRGLGTPHFMAPEQFRNAKNADVRCDIYSLGATLYMMVTGEIPFGKASGPLDAWMKKINNEIPTPRKLVPDLSERLDWAIRRAMSADPALRPSSCREFVEDLTGHSTRKITTPDSVNAGTPGNQDLWYLVYKDDEGVAHTVKGSIEGIRRSLRERLLGDASNVRASKSKQGPFELLKNYPEFRDLIVSLTQAPNTPTNLNTPVGNRPTSPPMPMPQTTPAPHIRLHAEKNDSISWVVGLALIGVAAAVALATFYIFFAR